MSHEFAPKDCCPRCGEILQPQSMFRVDLCRNWNNTQIKSFIICHRCLRNIEQYINEHPDYNHWGFDMSEKRNELLGRGEYHDMEEVLYQKTDNSKENK